MYIHIYFFTEHLFCVVFHVCISTLENTFCGKKIIIIHRYFYHANVKIWGIQMVVSYDTINQTHRQNRNDLKTYSEGNVFFK